MSDINMQISVEPVGADRFAINIVNTATGRIIKAITGNDLDGLTEADLRSASGLPKCGLSETQIDRAIRSANVKRCSDPHNDGTPLL